MLAETEDMFPLGASLAEWVPLATFILRDKEEGLTHCCCHLRIQKRVRSLNNHLMISTFWDHDKLPFVDLVKEKV